MPHQVRHQTGTEMEACIRDCLDCYQTCEQTLSHCHEMGGKHVEQAHVRLLADCARICFVSADFMIRQSEHHAGLCGLCAEICEQCAQDCERVDPADAVMQECAEVCRRCSASCEKMAQAA